MVAPELIKQLSKVENLPTLPDVVTRVMAAVDAEETTAESLAELMAQDAAITGQLLRVANSVFYNASGMSTTSVAEAVARLGFREVRNVVVSLGVIDTFAGADVPFDYVGFWKHCLTTAIGAGRIARCSPRTQKGLRGNDNPYFVAGLLHDVGILLLCQNLPDRYAEVHTKAQSSHLPLAEVEQDLLGITHQDVGAALIRRWGLPWEVAAAAQCHHRPGEAPEESADYIQVVHLADWISNDVGHGSSFEQVLDRHDEQVWNDLGLRPDQMPELSAEVEEAAKDSELLLSLTV